jgi:hypothetical protein
LRTARSTDTGIARISVVAVLALVLVAGLIPSGVLSAAHLCRMACCAGKPSHGAGACNAILPNAGENETLQAANVDEHSSQHGAMQMSIVTVEVAASSEHCHTAKHDFIQQPAQRSTTSQPASVAAQAFTTPCSAECAAAALTFAQVRRPREAAALSIAVRPRPPTIVSRADSPLNLSFSSSARRRQSSPRAPPLSLVKLYV